MKKLSLVSIPVSITLIATLLLTGCGFLFTVKDAGPLTTKEYDFKGFNSVDIGSAIKADIEYGDTYNVRITTNENYFKDINVSSSDNTLKINEKPQWGIDIISRTLEVKIIMPELVNLKLSGASEGTVSGFNSSRDLSVKISGASKLELDMETGDFNAEINGASRMTATVVCSNSNIDLSGASELNLETETGTLSIKASGDSEVRGKANATKTGLNLSGASSIKLAGSGGDIELSGSGASDFDLGQYNIGDVDIDLEGASEAYMVINGTVKGSLSGASELLYEGNPVLGNKLDISSGSTFKKRK